MNCKNKIDISVIIPFYNGNIYITDCVKSVGDAYAFLQSQNKNITIEIIIVNDSPDIELEIVEVIDVDIVVLKNLTNVGIQQTRINGVKAANGEYILMLDQDDVLEKSSLYTQYSMIKKEKGDVIFGNALIENKDKSCRLNFKKHRVGDWFARNIWAYIILGNQIISPGQVLVKKEAVPSKWVNTLLSNNGSDDAFLWMLILLDGNKILYNHNIVYKHKFTGENVSGNRLEMYLSSSSYIDMIVNMTDVSKVQCHYLMARKRWMGIENSVIKKIDSIYILDYLLVRSILLLVRRVMSIF